MVRRYLIVLRKPDGRFFRDEAWAKSDGLFYFKLESTVPRCVPEGSIKPPGCNPRPSEGTVTAARGIEKSEIHPSLPPSLRRIGSPYCLYPHMRHSPPSRRAWYVRSAKFISCFSPL
jgi:hypothetical protein